jgi:hypothetical protein
MTVNNMGGHPQLLPSAMLCADPVSKFHTGIWLDPRVMKFVPCPKLKKGRERIREKIGEGEFRRLRVNDKLVSSADMPNVWGFGRRVWIRPDESFFLDIRATWGNQDHGVQKTGGMKTVCSMLLAIRILYYLGSRRIFLVGNDFYMDPKRSLQENYAFPESRSAGEVASNNEHFSIVNRWLCRMQETGVFHRFGLEIYNCYQMSRLRAFPYVPFDAAIASVLEGFPAEPFDLNGWYEKKGKKK